MIYVIPLGDMSQASSRLRIHNIAPYFNYNFNLPGRYYKGDILIIQKKPEYNEMKRAQKEGATVIYDIDDWYLDFKYMIEGADIVTVDNSYKKRLCNEAIVIPNSLDWDGTKREHQNIQKGLLGWTGYGNNAIYLNKIYLPLKRQNFKLRIIAGLPTNFAGTAEFVNWSRDTVDKSLAECQYGIIHLTEDAFARSKSEHKLLKNWAIGLPTYVTPTFAYNYVVEEAGVNKKCLVKDWRNLESIEFEPNMRAYALEYTPDKIAKQWEQVFQNI